MKFSKLLKIIKELLFGKSENFLYFVTSGEALPMPLDKESEEKVFTRLKAGDGTARGELIEHNLRLVVYIARKFDNTGIDVDDLISVGALGLIKAVNSFDPDKNIKLATYASRCIENEILMHLRRVNRLRLEVSLDEPLNVDFEGNELLIGDVLGTEPDLVSKNLETSVEKQLLLDAISRLNDRERAIMQMRFGLGGREEKTQKEVADMMGISQSYISRLEKKIICRLRKEIAKAL